MNAEQLFTKIGILTVENDMLKAELNRAAEQIKQLEARLEPQTAAPEAVNPPSKEK
jgi:hypothetical protein